jgi:DNA-binding NarL/FixJ family response regulator
LPPSFRHAGHETVAQAGSGEEAIELYEKYLPDIALVSALRRVHAGGRFLPTPVSRALSSRLPDSELSAT